MYRPEESQVNLQQILERIRNTLKRFRFGGGGLSLVVIGLYVVGALIWLGTGFYTVQPGEEAALRLFGEFSSSQQEGLHWYWPTPVGARDIVAVKQIKKLEVGVRGDTPVLQESLMITGDPSEEGQPPDGEAPNIVDVQLLVQYDIKSIRDYLYEAVDPDSTTIKDATETALRQVVGSRSIDDVLTDKKEDIQAETKQLLQKLLDRYQTGIRVTEVKLLSVFAPVQVIAAFDDVVKAKEDKARIINLADAYREDIIPRARGEAARLIQAAEAFKQEKIALAEGQAQRFKVILEEYKKAPAITRQRLYLEAMEDILPGVTKFIVSEEAGGGLLQFLPLTQDTRVPTDIGLTPP